MKRLIIIISTAVSILVAQPYDAAGFYKLSGLDVMYYSAAREAVVIEVSDMYGAGITLPISSISEGEIFYPYHNGPLTEDDLTGLGVNLNVLLNEDGSGALAEGSFYPDVNVDPDVCVSDLQVLPITDVLAYTSDATLNLSKTGKNVIGLPDVAAMSGLQYHGTDGYGGLSLSQSVTFDYFPESPTSTYICDAYDDCFDIAYPDGSVLPGGYATPSVTGGYWKSERVHGIDLGPSFLTMYPDLVNGGFMENTDPEFYLEWHAVDGIQSESGLGEILGEDEDGDGTDFDRIFGLPFITATYINPALGYNYPIYGDLTGSPLNDYITSVGTAARGYVMDPSGDLAMWGNFLTWNGVLAGQFTEQCVAAGGLEAFGTGFCVQQANGADFAAACGDAGVYGATYGLCMQAAGPGWEATCGNLAAGAEIATNDDCSNMPAMAPTICAQAGSALFAGYGTGAGEPYDCGNYITQEHMYGADDSGVDCDPTCLADGSPTDCEGRIVMDFTPTCVPQIEIREVCAEFIEIDQDTCGGGDVNSDGSVNVLDIVSLATCILAAGLPGECSNCQGDVNDDGNYNVLDIVALATQILGGRLDGATSAEFNVIENEVTMTANGYVGAVQMTLSHGSDFVISLTQDALVAEYVTDGNTTQLIIVDPTGGSLLTANSDFNIESVIAASNSETYMQTSITMPKEYSIGSAYPNPFNPSTQMMLNLNTDADVSVKVFNTLGQLVDVIVEGQMASGSYSLIWDGSNAASGVYLIQTEIGSEVHSQKIMLIK